MISLMISPTRNRQLLRPLSKMRTYTLAWKSYSLELGRRTKIMGVVNVTPDSFSDGGHFFNTDSAVEQALQLVRSGADIIDIGGESTRPYAREVDAVEEMKRVIPVIQALAPRIPVPISIDTTKSSVAQAALDAGASIINDISAFTMDPPIIELAARYDVPVIVMHMLGKPRTMQINPVYDDVVAEVRAYLHAAIETAMAAGIRRDRVIIDPGIGFGKTLAHNLLLLNHIRDLASLDVPILVGPSRKAFIRKLVSPPKQNQLAPDHPLVETGTQAAVAACALNGAHIVRVHDVANTRAMVTVLDAIRNASNDPNPAD
jgi:dihydropteroate synthase